MGKRGTKRGLFWMDGCGSPPWGLESFQSRLCGPHLCIFHCSEWGHCRQYRIHKHPLQCKYLGDQPQYPNKVKIIILSDFFTRAFQKQAPFWVWPTTILDLEKNTVPYHWLYFNLSYVMMKNFEDMNLFRLT